RHATATEVFLWVRLPYQKGSTTTILQIWEEAELTSIVDLHACQPMHGSMDTRTPKYKKNGSHGGSDYGFPACARSTAKANYRMSRSQQQRALEFDLSLLIAIPSQNHLRGPNAGKESSSENSNGWTTSFWKP